MKKVYYKKTIYVIVILLFLIALYNSRNILTTTYYTLSSSTISSLRIVQLTDLHNSEFGEENSRLIDAVRINPRT